VSPSERLASFRFEQRLHKPEEFTAVMAARRVVRGEYFDLHYRPVSADSSARLGLIVPKRLVRTASLRNAIKRQGREAFRLIAAEIPSCDLILRLTRPVKGVMARDGEQRKGWRREMESLLGRLSGLPQ
ncbi:MAG: ribonuclease P protein component, partial [Rhodocyclales bacterium]|nr:ribonuclease P protein component [Rhodocyclales bacterium]